MTTRHALSNDIKVYHALSPLEAGFSVAAFIGLGVATASLASTELLFPTVLYAFSYYTSARTARAGYERIKQEIRHKGIDAVVRNDKARHPAMIYARSSGQLEKYNSAVEACDYWRCYSSRR